MESKKDTKTFCDKSTNTITTLTPHQQYLAFTSDVFSPRLEIHRLYSFPENWSTLCPVPKEQLAENGFYYVAPGDATRCAFCRLVVQQWEQNDTAAGEHRRWNPACPFINGRHVGNVKLGEEELQDRLSLDKQRTSHKEINLILIQNNINNINMQNGPTILAS